MIRKLPMAKHPTISIILLFSIKYPMQPFKALEHCVNKTHIVANTPPPLSPMFM